jgi:nucleoside-triphosphatase THEP1
MSSDNLLISSIFDEVLKEKFYGEEEVLLSCKTMDDQESQRSSITDSDTDSINESIKLETAVKEDEIILDEAGPLEQSQKATQIEQLQENVVVNKSLFSIFVSYICLCKK